MSKQHKENGPGGQTGADDASGAGALLATDSVANAPDFVKPQTINGRAAELQWWRDRHAFCLGEVAFWSLEANKLAEHIAKLESRL